MKDEQTGAGAYKPDGVEEPRSGARRAAGIHLGRDRDVKLDFRNTAIAAGALGLSVLAYKGVSALLARKPKADRPGQFDASSPHPEPAPLAKDNAAPRFGSKRGGELSGGPFLAASGQDDTAGLVEVAKVDKAASGLDEATDGSARTPEHVPTDLMGDAPPGPNDRAIDAFRPDATAPVPPEMRESLRPATGPAPSLAANRGDFASGLSQTDGSK